MIKFNKTTKSDSLDNFNSERVNFLKYAMAVAVAGHHNIIVTGDDREYTLLMQNLLPNLNKNEVKENSKIYKLQLDYECRPFRIPHYSTSIEGMFGGGIKCTAGEISFANNGVLFLEDVTEFKTSVLQMLRSALRLKHIILSRCGNVFEYPANFQLAMTLKPCMCGNFGNENKKCFCSQKSINLYWEKMKPLLNDVAIQINLNDVEKVQNYSEKELQEKIKNAWEIQNSRNKGFNNDLKNLDYLNEVDNNAKDYFYLIKKQLLNENQSEQVLKLARTIADMEKQKDIQVENIEMAMSLSLGLENIKSQFEKR